MVKEYEMGKKEREECDREMLEVAYNAMESDIDNEEYIIVAKSIIKAMYAIRIKNKEICTRIKIREKMDDFWYFSEDNHILSSALYAHLGGLDITDVDPYCDAGFKISALTAACICLDAMSHLEGTLDFEPGGSGGTPENLLKVIAGIKP
jgi:hypothetical protein